MYFSKATIIAVSALIAQGFASPILETVTDCSAVRKTCQQGPDANQAYCASQAAECCDVKDYACRAGPTANMAECSSQKSTCYANANLPDPYGLGKRLDTDGAQCAAVRLTCQEGPDANQAYCASLAADCCQEKSNACRTGPTANQADCSARKSSCFAAANLPDPYGLGKRLDTDGAQCAAVRKTCQEGPDANQAYCASLAADCCQEKSNACRTGPTASMADCSARKSSCFAAANLPDPYAN
ncbi:hypothetical protein KVR01_000586 [Diaporthe batatas]|uniref:uncharacterized protein n=1 Tax=Diaporthe batatas TaxID=748121 RepID=UPI001D038390|nr:uncharacterized protein KVR01_000586 [Diaporthe batatas]KAG8169841.1 hypothetical protein KVR01_000586 [Diaporthe batatas]